MARQLIQLRRTHADLTTGRADGTTVKYDEADQWLVITLGSVVIACNLSSKEVGIPSRTWLI